jgi:hypothetical protein
MDNKLSCEPLPFHLLKDERTAQSESQMEHRLRLRNRDHSAGFPNRNRIFKRSTSRPLEMIAMRSDPEIAKKVLAGRLSISALLTIQTKSAARSCEYKESLYWRVAERGRGEIDL